MVNATPVEIFMLELINAERRKLGKAEYKLEKNLNEAAEDYSVDLLRTGRFSHTGADGSSATDRIRAAGFDLDGAWSTGENLALGTVNGAADLRDEVRASHEGLMKSPGHYANLMSDKYTHIGIGVETGSYKPNGTFETVMITQNFARTDGSVDVQTVGANASGGSNTLPSGGTTTAKTTTAAPTKTANTTTADKSNPGREINKGNGDDVVKGTGGDDVIRTSSGDDEVWGGGGADKVFAGNGDDLVRGQAGDDRLTTGNGSDKVFGNGGDDMLRTGTGNDEARGGHGDDYIDASNGNDLVFGGAGDDEILAGQGNDEVRGGTGRDDVKLGAGNDIFRDESEGGRSGADVVVGGAGNDRLYGGGGSDTFRGGGGDDWIGGGAGGDLLVGHIGDDRVHGHRGHDDLRGGDGDDWLYGGGGDDDLEGGEGADTFVYRTGEGYDVVLDFEVGVDTLRLDDALWGGGLSAQQVVDRYGDANGTLDFGGGAKIMLDGVSNLDAIVGDMSFF